MKHDENHEEKPGLIRRALLQSRFLWIAILIGLGGNLFYISLEARLAEEQLAKLQQDIVIERERIKVLEAELAYLSRPAYLQKVNGLTLGLESISPQQILRFSDLPERTMDDPPVVLPPASQQSLLLTSLATEKTPSALDRFIRHYRSYFSTLMHKDENRP